MKISDFSNKENVIADKFIRPEVDRMTVVWDGLCYASMKDDLIKKAEEMILSKRRKRCICQWNHVLFFLVKNQMEMR